MKIFQITGSGYLNIKEKMRVLIYEDLKKFQRIDDWKEAVTIGYDIVYNSICEWSGK